MMRFLRPCRVLTYVAFASFALLKSVQAAPIDQKKFESARTWEELRAGQGWPELNAALKLPVAKRLEIATIALVNPRREARNLDFGFALALSMAKQNRDAVRLVARGILSNEYTFGKDRIARVLRLLANEGIRGSSSCVVAWARLHDLGLDMPQDATRAYEWYRWGALVGNQRGIEETAFALAKGKGTDKNVDVALEWLNKLPPQRRAKQYAELGDYLAATGMPDDFAKSEVVYLDAMQTDPLIAIGVAAKLNDGRYSESARKAAMAVIASGDANGSPLAQRIIAKGLWESTSEADISKAILLFLKAAKTGDQDAVNYLALAMSRSGVSTGTHIEIFPVLEKQARLGNTNAIRAVGEAYFSGRGTSLSLQKAAEFRRLAADRGDVEAQYLLGLMYIQANGVDKDIPEATKWLTKSAEAGNLIARSALMSLTTK
ncbi:tetratricopeptide repeat protein [Pararhizobium antarcticum]|uniref:Sel1 repeat protein n=1 Tax=Pararhizobium antarcticum TaxID=1798805 RepID=A0A657LM78_9HYPH|nr:tetratricopeptide repeat protein [Pararhizobium antarcticum]OJF91666.1 hypothetical protein AX760_23155 [Pararhizobium antarcticum]OJF96126.1 hypothetical protein AX761_16320 [Rhizobium sp. 58]